MKDYTLKSAASERELARIDDGTLSEDVKRKIEKQRRKEKGLVPLRVDGKTVIFVKPENANPEYAAAYDAKVRKNRYIYRSEFKKGNV
jgi:hypothetical protein